MDLLVVVEVEDVALVRLLAVVDLAAVDLAVVAPLAVAAVEDAEGKCHKPRVAFLPVHVD